MGVDPVHVPPQWTSGCFNPVAYLTQETDRNGVIKRIRYRVEWPLTSGSVRPADVFFKTGGSI